jgi:Skp family chaperone for outer membrane proteins
MNNMKNILRTLFPAVLLLAFMGGTALAQTKIATVNLKTLFDSYWKTKQAQASIQDRATQLDKDDKSMKDDLKKGSEEYQQLLSQANDQAISSDERDKRKQAATEKLKQLEERRTAIDQYERQAQATLNDQRQRMREKILVDIQGAVTTKAKSSGYALVIDIAAESISGTPSVVYHTDDNDLTDVVLKQLNAGAPIDLTSTNSAPVIPPLPLLLSTNRP